MYMYVLVLMLQVYSVCMYMYVLVLMLQVYSVCMYVLVLILQVYSVCMLSETVSIYCCVHDVTGQPGGYKMKSNQSHSVADDW